MLDIAQACYSLAPRTSSKYEVLITGSEYSNSESYQYCTGFGGEKQVRI